MVLSWEDRFICTLIQEFRDSMKLNERGDILDMVRGRVPKMLECPKKFYGWEDKEFWEDSWKSIEMLKRSQKISIIISILLQKVINSRTRVFWLKLFTKWNKKRSERSNWLIKEKPEDRRMLSRKKRELIRNLNLLDYWKRLRAKKRNPRRKKHHLKRRRFRRRNKLLLKLRQNKNKQLQK